MKIWRLKTKEEFIADNRWNDITGAPVGWNAQKKMNHLIGQRVDQSEYISCKEGRPIIVGKWRVGATDYVCVDEEFRVGPGPVISNPETGESSQPMFDLERLAKTIDDMFQVKLDNSQKTHLAILKYFQEGLKKEYASYEEKLDHLFPDIKESLIAEIQRGHTTIVMPDHSEIAIQAMDHPKMKDVMMSMHMQRKAMLVGPAGTGKTYMVAEIASRLDLPFYKYSCSRDSSVHDLLGYKQPQSETYLETVFLKAYEQGGIFLVDEYDAMSGDMSLFFNGIADASKFISIPHRDDRPIAKKHKDFYLVMCGNTWGKGSVEYSGRDFQDMALMDRFRFCRHFIGYHEALEKAWMGQNYNFVLKLREHLEKLGSYLSTRNIEDVSNLIASGCNKTQIVDMIGQDLTEEDKKILTSNMNSIILIEAPRRTATHG